MAWHPGSCFLRSDSQLAQRLREAADNVRATLLALAGIAVIFGLITVGTAAAGEGEATERHQGVERPARRQ